ncbi:hypothetical protein Kpol_1043p6 [Vanderwaltozyma polyspora DSM 70294]|uniref:Uncharacterized protein n=1 Tax=Vanderwaltozyma polyspora (strain ATCC 22028 / DSM 70294 / BCRC 21397 / CBS 2163 / NBRC 10782 / NRRL Y-8283 / UCD 57-17) TaxID=436907 RepID=A7TIM4_VANPO|nr:uncharacterized protein Kpol_1043p6 [Vanderwaltozyma polyspora DSM 70294]EDO17816.1 hypothetical protein Kpol_1043p6 [Vanderwaltozyma polyspora DSM 70294]
MSTPAAEQRKLLEQLMGRDGGYEQQHHHGGRGRYGVVQKDLGLHDARICKSYLVGECPYDLFLGTKQSMGRCPQIHLAKYRIQYEKEGGGFPEFEREYYAILSKFVNECNGQIAVALKNLEHTPEEREKINNVTQELDVLDTKIGLMDQEIVSLLKADEVSKAMAQSLKLEDMKLERVEVAKRVRNITENVGQSAQQKLQVCEVCGAYLSRLDTDRRIADHFLGKIHLGYVKMREELETLRNKQKKRTLK